MVQNEFFEFPLQKLTMSYTRVPPDDVLLTVGWCLVAVDITDEVPTDEAVLIFLRRSSSDQFP